MTAGPEQPGLQDDAGSSRRAPGRQDFADEADLLVLVANGGGEAFRQLLDRHLAVVVLTARRILNDEAEAEDVAQETFMRLWRRAKDLEVGAAGIRPWLRKVGANLAIDRVRSNRRVKVVGDVPEETEEAGQLAELEKSDVAARVEAAVATLPERQRIALCLFHYDELSQWDIGEMMNISVEAVESLLARARRGLRKELEDDWRALLDEG